MVRRVNLLISALAFVLFLVSVSSASYAVNSITSCTALDRRLGICTSGTSDGTGVDVTGTIDQSDDGNGSSTGTGRGGSGHPLTDTEILALLNEACYGNGPCGLRNAVELNPRIPVEDGAAGADGEAPAVVTIADLARFLPAAAALHAEPDGRAVVGVPANFWVDVSAVTVFGSLLGDTAQVRFTPQTYRFDYGDGSTRTSSMAGTSWAELGQDELTETPTGHTYDARGDRQAAVTVVYSAQYRFADGPWIGVAGAVSDTTPPQRVLVVVERTALTTPA